jgi:hypothetical protein
VQEFIQVSLFFTKPEVHDEPFPHSGLDHFHRKLLLSVALLGQDMQPLVLAFFIRWVLNGLPAQSPINSPSLSSKSSRAGEEPEIEYSRDRIRDCKLRMNAASSELPDEC